MENGSVLDIDVPTQIRECAPETAVLVSCADCTYCSSAKREYHLLHLTTLSTQVRMHFAAVATKYHVATTV